MDPLYTVDDLNTYFYAYGRYSDYELTPLNEYSLNKVDVKLSSPNINRALRNKK